MYNMPLPMALASLCSQTCMTNQARTSLCWTSYLLWTTRMNGTLRFVQEVHGNSFHVHSNKFAAADPYLWVQNLQQNRHHYSILGSLGPTPVSNTSMFACYAICAIIYLVCYIYCQAVSSAHTRHKVSCNCLGCYRWCGLLRALVQAPTSTQLSGGEGM